MESNTESNTDRIIKGLQWLEDRTNSTDIISITHGLNTLAILAVRLAEEVTDAYELQCELEDEYDTAFAKRFSELTSNGTSAAAAKPAVEAELADAKKEWTRAKVLYRKLSTFLERVDRVLEAFRQSVSVQKAADLKNV